MIPRFLLAVWLVCSIASGLCGQVYAGPESCGQQRSVMRYQSLPSPRPCFVADASRRDNALVCGAVILGVTLLWRRRRRLARDLPA